MQIRGEQTPLQHQPTVHALVLLHFPINPPLICLAVSLLIFFKFFIDFRFKMLI